MRIVRIALVLAACAGLIWLSAKSAAVSALLKQNLPAAALIAPNDPRVVMRLAMVEYGRAGGSVGQEMRAATLRALTRAPLAEEPFQIAATAALARKDPGAERLLQEAAGRNPRSRLSQLLLLDRQLRAGRIEDAANTINLLGRLIPGARSVLTGQLAQFARDPSTRPSLLRALADAPETKGALLEHLAGNVEDADLVLALAGPENTPTGAGSLPDWQKKLLASLLENGQVQRAFQLWSRYSGVNPSEAGTQIYDPAFKGLRAPPPFNWTFADSSAGIAESNGTSGLAVQYYGREDARLVEQMLILRPGRYRLSSRVDGNSSGEGGKLSWRVSCYKSNQTLLDLSPATGEQQHTVSGEFTIPAGCEAQSIALVGTPAEFAKNMDVTVSDLVLEKVS